MTTHQPQPQTHPPPQQPLVAIEREPFNQLTKRERQVAVMVALALSDQQIARSLVITVRTVRAHLDVIKSKLHLASRAEVIRWMLVSHYERNIDIYDNVL